MKIMALEQMQLLVARGKTKNMHVTGQLIVRVDESGAGGWDGVWRRHPQCWKQINKEEYEASIACLYGRGITSHRKRRF